MPRRTPGMMSPTSLQELAWQQELTTTQDTPIPVVTLHVADTGVVTWLAVPLHLSSRITHGDISFSQVIYPATFKPCLFHGCLQYPEALQRSSSPHSAGSCHTSLSGYLHLSYSPPCKETTHTGPSPCSGGSRCGVLGKGQMD